VKRCRLAQSGYPAQSRTGAWRPPNALIHGSASADTAAIAAEGKTYTVEHRYLDAVSAIRYPTKSIGDYALPSLADPAFARVHREKLHDERMNCGGPNDDTKILKVHDARPAQTEAQHA